MGLKERTKIRIKEGKEVIKNHIKNGLFHFYTGIFLGASSFLASYYLSNQLKPEVEPQIFSQYEITTRQLSNLRQTNTIIDEPSIKEFDLDTIVKKTLSHYIYEKEQDSIRIFNNSEFQDYLKQERFAHFIKTYGSVGGFWGFTFCGWFIGNRIRNKRREDYNRKQRESRERYGGINSVV